MLFLLEFVEQIVPSKNLHKLCSKNKATTNQLIIIIKINQMNEQNGIIILTTLKKIIMMIITHKIMALPATKETTSKHKAIVARGFNKTNSNRISLCSKTPTKTTTIRKLLRLQEPRRPLYRSTEKLDLLFHAEWVAEEVSMMRQLKSMNMCVKKSSCRKGKNLIHRHTE